MPRVEVPYPVIDWSNPRQRQEFERFFKRMPDVQREIAIEALDAVGLPTSQEFLKAYTMGVAVCMSAYEGRGPSGGDRPEDEGDDE